MLDLVIPARPHAIGTLEVGRVLPFMRRRMVGPFIFLDHIGPIDLPAGIPRSADVRPHPHIGLATITYLFAGEITHRDSLGYEQVIRPAEVNWMNAGRAISHSERFDGMRATGGLLHGVQAWVALPERDEESDPGFEHYAGADMPVIEERGISGRLIAGEALGLKSGVRTRSPLFYLHLALAPGARIALPAAYAERAAYVIEGAVEHDGQRYERGQMLVFSPGTEAAVTALAPAIVMALGGEPVGERHIWWNFVSSRKERIEQAKADWQAGRIALPAADNSEFIPLPETPAPRPEPLS
jgi:redox-sensitive bicupin YhaK (pirin superfamily)